MPYIGNQHNVGDHVNNFKVLDDISSHTATFDGSATSVVSAADDTIRIPEHRFIQGQRVTYTNGGGGNIGGLTTGTAYFVSFDTANTIKLATTLANANSNTVINLSAVGSGTSHTLNVAFDGVNTKFKMTHGSGKSARLNNATQLNVAINNVIQRPNLDPNNFTDGFALQDNHKIVFKTAPTVNDVFWGSIIANTIENFDLRDNEVDNFTGDGSTTEFTLSTIPANNESVIVSINGVVQHPSDKNTARSYTLIDSIIQFTAAPALGDGIQVRHIGFAGASTNDVSGFYGRTGNVALTSSDHITTGDITSRNINSSGIITATTFSGGFSGNVVGTSATFTGNLFVGGVLSYEDVTNVDSVGIITAQKDIHVGAGVSAVGVGTFGSLDISGDIDVDGHTNLDNVSIAGVTTHADNASVKFGTDGDFSINHSGSSLGMSNTTGEVLLRNTGGSLYFDCNQISLRIAAGSQTMLNAAPSGVTLYTSNSSKLATTNTGVSLPQDLDVDGHTELDNVNVSGVVTFTNSPNGIQMNDNARVSFGTSLKTSIAYNSSASRTQIRNWNDTLEIGYRNTEIHHTNQVRLSFLNGQNTFSNNASTTFAGDNYSALWNPSSDTFRFNDNAKLVFGTNNDTTIYHNNAHFYITNTTGKIRFTGDVRLNNDLDVDGHTHLDNVSISGITTFSGQGIRIENATNPFIHLKDTTNNTDSYLSTDDGGSLYLKADDNQEGSSTKIVFQVDGSEKIYITSDGAVSWRSGTTPISGTGNNYSLNIYRDSGGGYGYFDVVTSGSNHTGVILRAYHNGTYNHVLEHNTSDYTRFYIGGIERVRIASNGKLHIGGLTTNSTGSFASVIATGGELNNGGFQAHYNSGAYGGGSMTTVNAAGGGLDFWTYTGNVGSESYTRRLRIDSSGRIGVGVVPIAQFDHNLIQIGNQATLGANAALSTTGQTFLTHNLYFDPSGNYQVFNTSNANEGAIFRLVDGNFLFSNSAQTTGTPTVIERLRINSSGNVKLPDNSKIEFGGSQSGSGDFYLNFDGTYATMHSGGNQMNIRSNRIQLGDNGGVLYIDCTDNSTVKLYHQSGGVATEKLTTASFGIDIPDTLRLSNSYADTGSQMCLGADSSGNCNIAGYNLKIATGNNNSRSHRFTFSHSAFYPAADNAYDLGAYNFRWKDLYVGDAHFSNRDSKNEVDGTWGDWTLQEGETKIFMINNRTGKKYSLVMEEE